ncbi:MAG: hypothetical protein II342_02570, partial [Clostridia bacterium]|nr:hypothetical protein [Clostridia bacterium]
SGDKSKLLSDCFATSPQIIPHLNNDDKALLNEFLQGLGKGDTAQEIERCASFITLFDNKITVLSGEVSEQQRLYKSLGFFSGVFLCIFFI